MNRTDRLLAIVLTLQSRKSLRAEDLAAEFETSVRTIYRDMQALSEAGVPVVGAPGTGYSLMEGYFLPPVSFTSEEAVALLIGTDFIGRYFDDRYGSCAETSRRKIEAILPENIRTEAGKVRATIRLLSESREDATGEYASLGKLRLAVLQQRKVRLRYIRIAPGTHGEQRSDRIVLPYGLMLVQGKWMLLGYCELRREIRHFRVSRITDLTLLDEKFHLPDDFDLQAYSPPDDRNQVVIVQASLAIADHLKDTGNFYLDRIEEQEDRLLLTLRVRKPEDVLSWIMSYGANMNVLEPAVLRERVREEAKKILEHY
ncbi:YafY family protein [Paenibacillus sp. YPG26]|uniref:helix-turn-helix transcriptional regulator n=1 Tax=Paenibacillus sp. YPG26 TaxID=2878915 RepID=UPI00203D8965|nr:YafY family protein [Paenibacillus sp. YPG26]USB33049.1 YafY family transcriptional regulator [Paenibacillus sp. YPG26]